MERAKAWLQRDPSTCPLSFRASGSTKNDGPRSRDPMGKRTIKGSTSIEGMALKVHVDSTVAS